MGREMDAIPGELDTLVAHHRIRECVVRLARGEDRRSAALISASFWPDATVDLGIFAGRFDEYLAWVVPGSPAIPNTQHLLGQTHVDLNGDTARAETHVTAYHRVDTGTEERDAVIGGRYLDRLERRDGQWRILRRTMLYDWVRDLGISVDWTQGVMGMPFQGDHYTGRAVADHSETFFDN